MERDFGDTDHTDLYWRKRWLEQRKGFASALTNLWLVILPFVWYVASDCDMLPAAADWPE